MTSIPTSSRVAAQAGSSSPAASRPRTQAGLASSLRIAVGRLHRRVRFEREEGHTLNQVSALGTLERHGPMPIGELADHERVRPPSITRTAATLEKAGLVVREPREGDRRVTVVRITDAGRAFTAADRERRDVWLAQRLGELTPDERAKLHAVVPVLEKLARS